MLLTCPLYVIIDRTLRSMIVSKRGDLVKYYTTSKCLCPIHYIYKWYSILEVVHKSLSIIFNTVNSWRKLFRFFKKIHKSIHWLKQYNTTNKFTLNRMDTSHKIRCNIFVYYYFPIKVRNWFRFLKRTKSSKKIEIPEEISMNNIENINPEPRRRQKITKCLNKSKSLNLNITHINSIVSVIVLWELIYCLFLILEDHYHTLYLSFFTGKHIRYYDRSNTSFAVR